MIAWLIYVAAAALGPTLADRSALQRCDRRRRGALVVAHVDAVDAYPGPRVGGVDHLALTDVHRNVLPPASRRGEEHEITGRGCLRPAQALRI